MRFDDDVENVRTWHIFKHLSMTAKQFPSQSSEQISSLFSLVSLLLLLFNYWLQKIKTNKPLNVVMSH